jgi:hypothetical protein
MHYWCMMLQVWQGLAESQGLAPKVVDPMHMKVRSLRCPASLTESHSVQAVMNICHRQGTFCLLQAWDQVNTQEGKWQHDHETVLLERPPISASR